MHLDNRTGWPFAPIAGRLGWPKHSLTAVLKATYRLVPDGVAEPADEPLPLVPDVFADGDDPAVDAPRYPSDLEEEKPRADLLLVGRAWAPGGRRARQFTAAFQVGSTRKELRVTGDRRWDPGLLRSGVTDPEPVRSVELSWRNAFGGPGFAANPVGKGLAGDPPALPNLEDPADPATSPQSRPAPAAFGPRSRVWAPRAGRVGTFDAEWFRTRCPWYPADRAPDVANAAPADLQVEGWLRGDELAILENLHPEHARIECRLPGVAPRCFARRRDGGFVEAPLRLDTLWIDAETLTLALVWRGVLEVATDDFSDLAKLFVVPDVCGRDARPADAWCAELLGAETGAGDGDDAGDGPAPGSGPGAAQLAAPDPEEVDDGVPRDLPPAPEPPDDEALRSAVLALKSEGVADLDATDLLDAPPPAEAGADAEAEAGPGAEAQASPPWTAAAALAAAAAGESLAGANLAGLDLRGAALDGVDLEGADLAGAQLDGATARGAHLAGANLAGVSAVETCLDGSWLPGADLSGAALERASLAGTDLAGARLERARLDGAQLAHARLDGARAAGARFVRACLREAQLDGFDGAAADFTGADLTGASLAGATCRDATFDRATLPGSTWEGADASGARFVYAEASGADFTAARLERVDFARGNFRRACLRKARLGGAHLREANLFEALLVYADLAGADARKANLYGAELADASRRDLRVEGANVRRTKLDPAPRFP